MTLHRGKIARAPTVTNVRALTRDDLALVVEKRPLSESRAGGNILQRLRDPHHRVARLIASGLKLTEVAELTGRSYAGLHLLNRDPAFNELVATYRGKVNAAWEREQDEYAQLATRNMLKAEAQIAEKLEAAEENNETLPTRDLIAISRDAADRFGYGKRQTNLNVNADFASLLEKAIARSGKGGPPSPVTIEGRALSSASQSPLAPEVPASDTPREPVPLAAAGLRRV